MTLTLWDDLADGAVASLTAGSCNDSVTPKTIAVGIGLSTLPSVVNGWYGDLYDLARGTPLNDSKAEVVRVTSLGSSITFTRNQLGTTAQNHSGAVNLGIQRSLKTVDVQAIQTAINNLEAGGSFVNPNTDSAYSAINGFRLTLLSQTPVNPDSNGPQSTIYFTPYTNKTICLFDGTEWKLYYSEEVSTSAPSPDGMYDVFVYWDGGASQLVITFVAWFSSTVQWDSGTSTGSNLTSAAQQMLTFGVDNTQRYVGSVYVNGGNFQDDPSGRYVWNFVNQRPRALVGSIASAASSSSTWASVLSLPFCVGSPYDSNYATPPPYDTVSVTAQVYGQGEPISGAFCEAALTLAAPTPDTTGGHAVISATIPGLAGLSLVTQLPNPGLNSVDLLLRTSIDTNAVTLSSPDGSFDSNAVKAMILA